jgi:DNA-binding CsgD family transcriptional regulator
MVPRLGYNVLSSSRSAPSALRQAKTQGVFSLRLVNQRSAQRNNEIISHDRRAIDRGIQSHQIAPHHDSDPRFMDRSSSMTPGWKLATLISGTGTPTSKDRELPPFVGSLLSPWDAGYTGDRSAQSGSRVKEALTPRERDVLAMISQGLSNKRIARTLEISPETVKTHVKRVFLKLTVSTRTEAVYRAASLGLLGLDAGDRHDPSRKQQSHASQGKIGQEVNDGM